MNHRNRQGARERRSGREFGRFAGGKLDREAPLSSPKGYAASPPEAFRTVSLGAWVNEDSQGPRSDHPVGPLYVVDYRLADELPGALEVQPQRLLERDPQEAKSLQLPRTSNGPT